MKYYEPAAWLVLACLLLLFIVPAGAGSIEVVPTAITINCTTDEIVTRTAVISATDNVTGLNLHALDMLGLSGATSIPPPAIHLPAVPSNLSNGSIEQVPIGFDFKNATGGIYSGDVWVSSSDGVVKIPVTATVRSGPLVPALILIVTVILSYLLFSYGSGMKRRDEIEGSLEIIKDGIDNSELREPILYDREDRPPSKLPNPYYWQLNNDIESVLQQIDFKDTTAANTANQQLEKDFQKWKADRPRVKGLFTRFSETIRGLNTVEQQILTRGTFKEGDPLDTRTVPVVETARKALQEKFGAVRLPDDQSVNALDNEVGNADKLHKGLDQAVTLIMAIGDICKKKKQDDNVVCKGVPAHWEKLQSPLLIDPDELIGKLKDDWKTANELPPLPVPESRGEPVPREPEKKKKTLQEIWEWLKRAWTRVWEFLRQRANRAKARLFLYEWGSFLVMIAVLAATGYSLLYLSNPTFGASIDDYLTLMLWGLLVGPTADAVSKKTSSRVLA